MANKKLSEEKSGDLLVAILDSIKDAVLVIDPKDFTIIMANSTLLEAMKMRREAVIGKTCYKVLHHRTVPCVPPNDVCFMMTEIRRSITVERACFDEEGNKSYWEISANPIMDQEMNITHIVITAHREYH